MSSRPAGIFGYRLAGIDDDAERPVAACYRGFTSPGGGGTATSTATSAATMALAHQRQLGQGRDGGEQDQVGPAGLPQQVTWPGDHGQALHDQRPQHPRQPTRPPVPPLHQAIHRWRVRRSASAIVGGVGYFQRRRSLRSSWP